MKSQTFCDSLKVLVVLLLGNMSEVSNFLEGWPSSPESRCRQRFIFFAQFIHSKLCKPVKRKSKLFPTEQHILVYFFFVSWPKQKVKVHRRREIPRSCFVTLNKSIQPVIYHHFEHCWTTPCLLLAETEKTGYLKKTLAIIVPHQKLILWIQVFV